MSTQGPSKGDPRPVAVDLFAGAGGMSLGFEQAGFDVLAAFDHDPVHLGVHKYNLPATEAVCSNIEGVLPETVEGAARKGWTHHNRAGEWDGKIDCLFGGPSCQGFSYIGTNNSADSRNRLVFEFARLVRDLQPKTFVIENVPGLLSERFSGTRRTLYRLLSDAGYRILTDEPLLLDAANFGVPQFRRRVFIVGTRPGIEVEAPEPSGGKGPSVRDALAGLPNIDNWESLRVVDVLNLTAKATHALEISASPYGQTLRQAFGNEYPREWNRSELSGCQRTIHTDAVVDRFAEIPVGGEDGPSRFRRLDPKSKSFTLRAGTGRDHGSFTAPRPIHHRHPRVITIREAARLHSFPDWFRFHRTKWHGYRQIGNAVPPRLAYAVAKQVIESLDLSLIPPTDEVKLRDPQLLSMSLQEAADYFGYSRSQLPRDIRRSS